MGRCGLASRMTCAKPALGVSSPNPKLPSPVHHAGHRFGASGPGQMMQSLSELSNTVNRAPSLKNPACANTPVAMRIWGVGQGVREQN